MPEYTSKVYKITSEHTNKIYIGSCSNIDLNRYFSIKKSHYRSYLRRKSNFLTAFEIMKYSDATMKLLEDCGNCTRTELLQREQYWIDKLRNICVNKQNPFASKEQKKQTWDAYLLKYNKLITTCPDCKITIKQACMSHHKKSQNHILNVHMTFVNSIEFLEDDE